MGSKAKILVCTHTDSFYLQSDLYQPIHVGKAMHPEREFPFPGDDTGDNISMKNGSYCELTATYWAWKNLKDLDYIGIAHYRRYFDFAARETFANNDMEDVSKEELERRCQNVNPLSLMEDGTEVVLSRPSYIPTSVGQSYSNSHVPEDFHLLCRVILKLYPEYEPTLRKHFFCSNKWIGYNMLFCKKELFDKYAEWLFNILFEVEKYCKVSEWGYQSRVFGFMGEILTPLFFLHNCKKIKHKPVLYVSDNPGKVGDFQYLRNKLRFTLAFKLKCPRTPAAADPRGMFFDAYFKRDGIDF